MSHRPGAGPSVHGRFCDGPLPRIGPGVADRPARGRPTRRPVGGRAGSSTYRGETPPTAHVETGPPCGPPCEDSAVTHLLAGRAENRMQARLVAMLRDAGPLSRVELADRLAVSRTTVAAEVNRLVDLGLAAEVGPAAPRGGPPSPGVDLSDGIRFVGVSVGATSVSVGITDGRLGVLSLRTEPCDVRLGPEKVLAVVLDLTREMLNGHDARPAGVGIGVPGPVNFHRGIPVSPPIMPGWDGYPVRDAVSQELGCPVLLDNDVNVMALGEQHSGVARTVDDFLLVKIGTGIGCGFVVRGELYRGVDGCAGDIG